MAERKPHILLNGFVQNEDFQSRRTGRGAKVPLQNRASHGQALAQQYAAIQSGYDTSEWLRLRQSLKISESMSR